MNLKECACLQGFKIYFDILYLFFLKKTNKQHGSTEDTKKGLQPSPLSSIFYLMLIFQTESIRYFILSMLWIRAHRVDLVLRVVFFGSFALDLCRKGANSNQTPRKQYHFTEKQKN